MKTKIENNKVKYIVRLLIALSLVIVCATAAKVSAFVRQAGAIPQRIEKAITLNSKKDDSLKDVQQQYAETAKKLKEKNFFTSPPPPKKNPVTKVDGIIGDSVLIGGKLYKKGAKIGDAEIVSIDPRSVTISWNKQQISLSPFDHMAAPAPDKKTKNQPTPEGQPAETTVVQDQPTMAPPQQVAPQRTRPSQLTPEERERRREQFRERSAQRSGERRDRGSRSGDGGGRNRQRN